MNPSQPRPDLRDYLRILRRRAWIVLLCVVAIPAATYFYSKQLEKVYESSAVLQIQASAVDTSLFSAEFTPPERSLAAAARLIQTTGVAQEASRELNEREGGRRAGSLLGRIQVTPDEDTGFVTLTAADSDPQQAAAIANAFAAAVVETRSRQAKERVDQAIGEVTTNLRRLPRGDPDARRQLSQQLQRFRALRAAQGENAQVVEPAVASSAPVSPKPRRNAMLALVLAILIGIGLAFLAERLDRRIKDPEELERLADSPLLAAIPKSAFPGEHPTPGTQESFQTLRASLTYFNIDKPLSSVIVTSPLKGDGKTTVATNLAVSVARSGKNVILVDADLRNPQVARRMGVESELGLSNVLVAAAPADEALVEVEVFGPRLRVMPSGPPPPNPSELVGSKRMQSLIGQLSQLVDLVVIDTPPSLTVSDAVPLFKQVSGTVVVARVDQTPRDAVTRLMKVISSASGSVFGVVATGIKPGAAYGYYGGYGYGADGKEAPVTTNGMPDVKSRSPLSAAKAVLSRRSARGD